MNQQKNIRIALAGNPNSGKTSLFNALTGSHQHVGNYPGVTVEKKEGHFVHEGVRIDLLDLPGTYSLTSFSPEERIARREILDGRFDVVVVVVDSTILQRNLYLLTQVMLAGGNPILCLNMSDEARAMGQRLDLEQMERLLGFPVVETVASRKEGVPLLKDLILRAAESPVKESRLVLGERLDSAIAILSEMLEDSAPGARPPAWLASKMLEADDMTRQWVRKRLPDRLEKVDARAREMREEIEERTGLDVTTFVADRMYGYVAGLLKEVVLQPLRKDARIVSDRLDAVLCHRGLGLVFFLLAMYGLFWLTFSIGDYPMGWIETFFGWAGERISAFWPEGSDSPLRSLLVDGIIGGVGGVVVFLPNIVLLFLGLAFLEDTGYMARAAFLVDRWMHKFGLHGKSFIPMMTGFGCTIPGIMATRTLENERDRLTTMLVLPLISCGARLPIWMLLIPAFFAESYRAPMLWLIYMIGILLAAVLARLLRSTLLKGEDAPFVMELPPYRMPTLKALFQKMGERSWLYLKKAGTIILGISILLWAISYYPRPENLPVDRELAEGKIVVNNAETPENAREIARPGVEVLTTSELEHRREQEEMLQSLAGGIGRLMEPLLKPMGFDWRIGVALIGAFAAKEVFVAQMGIVFALGSEVDEESDTLRERIGASYPPLVGFSLMLFLLIATPCMATVAVTKRESGSWKWALLQFGGLTGIAWMLSVLVYQIGRLAGIGL